MTDDSPASTDRSDATLAAMHARLERRLRIARVAHAAAIIAAASCALAAFVGVRALPGEPALSTRRADSTLMTPGVTVSVVMNDASLPRRWAVEADASSILRIGGDELAPLLRQAPGHGVVRVGGRSRLVIVEDEARADPNTLVP